ncbi:MAG: hypothetical protein EU517_01215, partial [Promethearchaeota archaeon]
QLHYFVGLGSLISSFRLELSDIFNQIDTIQNRFNDVTVQFFDTRLILNYKHVYYACYHALKSIQLERNISNKIGIEFLLYLAADRQIKKALKHYGITNAQLLQKKLAYCIISLKNNLDAVLKNLLKGIGAEEVDLDLTKKSYAKYETIKDYFELNDNQIKTVLKSYEKNTESDLSKEKELERLYLALEDLICEKMVLLSLEKQF